MKILHYIPVYAPAWKFGGPVQSVSQLCEALVAERHQVEVFTSNAGLKEHPDCPVNVPVVRNGVMVTYFAQEPGYGIRCPGMERAVRAKAKEFEIIHISGVWQRTSRAACEAARQHKVPYVISIRGALGRYSWQHKLIRKFIYFLARERYNLRHSAAIHYTTQQEMDECRWLGLSGQPLVVPNGLDTDSWQPDPQAATAWRKNRGLAEQDFVLLNVGRLHHKKGLDLLPEALSSLGHLKWRMVLVGNDEDHTKVKLLSLFQRANMLHRVQCLEGCSPKDLPAIYSAANLFLLPSRNENFGNVVLEALACGCPVLISDRVGLHRDVAEAGTGWVLPRESAAWSAMLRRLMESPDLLEPAIRAARGWVESRFGIHAVAMEMAKCYLEIVSRHRITGLAPSNRIHSDS